MSVSRFLQPYYVVNLLAILSYIPLRLLTKPRSLVEEDEWFGIRREWTIYSVTVMFWLIKFRRSPTIDAFLYKFMLYGKTAVLLCLWYMDKRLMGWYAILFAFLYIMVKVPKFSGPEKVVDLSVSDFERVVLGHQSEPGHRGEKDKKKSWLVMFTAGWCDACSLYAPQFADLSLSFSSEALSFGRVDVSVFPELAEDFAVDASSASWQLPSLILFQNGQEKARLPHFSRDGGVVKVVLDKPGVIKYFELENRSGKNTTEAKNKKKIH